LIPENYFDLHSIFVNEIVGSLGLFAIIGTIIIFYFSIKNQVPFQAQIMLVALFNLILFITYRLQIVYVLILLLAGFIFYKALDAYLQRA